MAKSLADNVLGVIGQSYQIAGDASREPLRLVVMVRLMTS